MPARHVHKHPETLDSSSLSPHHGMQFQLEPTMSNQRSTEMASSLPPEALDLASRLFNAARQGDFTLLQQALDAGLAANMANEKGDTLVCVLWPLEREAVFLTNCSSCSQPTTDTPK